MYKRMISRYVEKVLEYLPIRDRRKARKVITRMIYARLDDYTEGLRPLGRDVRAVLRELGDPGDLAYAYYAEFHTAFQLNLDLRALMLRVTKILTVLAFVLVAGGIMGLILGSGNVTALVAGTALGILTVLYQMMILPGGKERSFQQIHLIEK